MCDHSMTQSKNLVRTMIERAAKSSCGQHATTTLQRRRTPLLAARLPPSHCQLVPQRLAPGAGAWSNLITRCEIQGGFLHHLRV